MGSKNRYDGVLSHYSIHLIRNLAISMTRTKGFSISDQEDIEQELVIRLMARLPKYDPSKASLETFIQHVLVNLASNMIRDRRALKNGVDVTVNLEDPVSSPGEEPCRLLDVLDPDESGLLGGVAPRTEEEQIQVRIDTEKLISVLPPELQEICYMLQDTSVAEIAIALGRHRTTIHKRIGNARDYLEENHITDPREN